MLLKGTNLVIERGGRQLLTIKSLEIHAHDRIGLVGVNGCGKSTLLHTLYGDLPLGAGELLRRAPMAMIAQDAYTERIPDKQWAKRLGLHKAVHSGGERTRWAIAAALSANAPLLLADEPTTNLDINGLLLLEKLLARYEGALVLVSHDRRLLDTLCTTIWALEDHTLCVYSGNYSDYLAQAEQKRQRALAEYQAYQAEKKRLEAAARLAKSRAKGISSTSHLSDSEARLPGMKGVYGAKERAAEKTVTAIKRRIEHLTVKEKPAPLPQITMHLGAARPITARKALTVKQLTVGYGQRVVLQSVSFTLPTGSRTVVMGPNGAGKSTLVQTLLAPHAAITPANGLKIGYFDQNHAQLNDDWTALANARVHSDLPEHVVRTILARLGLGAGELERPVSQLSGGQRVKVVFAQLLASDCNLLILDEPTNYLDSFAAESLEKLLLSWNGTLLVVTHDRQLADKIADRLLLVHDGGVSVYPGNWSAYLAAQSQPSGQQAALDDMILALRTAEITGKMALLRQKGLPEDPELEAQWQALTAPSTRKKETDTHAAPTPFN